jgi:uncharacterized membrane protein YpjA
MYIGLVLYVLIVFLLHRESLKLILVVNLSPRVFCHSWYQSKLGQHIEVPKNHNYTLSVRIV